MRARVGEAGVQRSRGEQDREDQSGRPRSEAGGFSCRPATVKHLAAFYARGAARAIREMVTTSREKPDTGGVEVEQGVVRRGAAQPPALV